MTDHLPWASGILEYLLLTFSVFQNDLEACKSRLPSIPPRIYNSADLGWVLIACVFNRFSGNAVAAGPEIAY